jgi:hypothetical protein
VDRITPTVLLYPQPANPLEAKFSLQFCAAVAIADGRIGVDTFSQERLGDPALRALMERVHMGVDEALGRNAPPLTEARVHVRLRGGRTLVREVKGARGTPDRPPHQRKWPPRSWPARTGADGGRARALECLDDLKNLLTSRTQSPADMPGPKTRPPSVGPGVFRPRNVNVPRPSTTRVLPGDGRGSASVIAPFASVTDGLAPEHPRAGDARAPSGQ